jgi:hypothetical protein
MGGAGCFRPTSSVVRMPPGKYCGRAGDKEEAILGSPNDKRGLNARLHVGDSPPGIAHVGLALAA